MILESRGADAHANKDGVLACVWGRKPTVCSGIGRRSSKLCCDATPLEAFFDFVAAHVKHHIICSCGGYAPNFLILPYCNRARRSRVPRYPCGQTSILAVVRG